jgi:predicted hotdog family 3-hydroxylacyl-ACP dehydratase
MQTELRREEIACLIPHAGAMCLIDRVLSWDDKAIRCLTTRHLAPDNPLRREGRLAAVCGVEFAAQAMALHGRLAANDGAPPRPGLLASLREVECRVEQLDLIASDLLIEAERLMGDEQQAVYRFAIRTADGELITGRACVLLQASLR